MPAVAVMTGIGLWLIGVTLWPLLGLIERASAIPPTMIILAVIGFGLLFGFAGVFLAAPLLLVAITLVRTLYVEDILGDRTTGHYSNEPTAQNSG